MCFPAALSTLVRAVRKVPRPRRRPRLAPPPPASTTTTPEDADMPPSSRQRAFSRDQVDNAAVFDALEKKAALPGPCVARYSASCMRKSKPANGLNVGVLYVTKTHLVFCAHFVSLEEQEVRIEMPLRSVAQARRAWYGRLLPHGVLLRCKGLPDYLMVLCSKDEQQKALATISTLLTEAKVDESSEDGSSPQDSELGTDDTPLPESEPEPEVQSDMGKVQVQAMRRVKFEGADTDTEIEPAPERGKSESGGDNGNAVQNAGNEAIANLQHKAQHYSRQDAIIFCVSSVVLLFATIGVSVALHLLHIRMTFIANRIATLI